MAKKKKNQGKVLKWDKKNVKKEEIAQPKEAIFKKGQKY